jgi:hypothetical protein
MAFSVAQNSTTTTRLPRTDSIVHLAAASMSCEVRKLVESEKEFFLIKEIAAKPARAMHSTVPPTDKEITQMESVS